MGERALLLRVLLLVLLLAVDADGGDEAPWCAVCSAALHLGAPEPRVRAEATNAGRECGRFTKRPTGAAHNRSHTAPRDTIP